MNLLCPNIDLLKEELVSVRRLREHWLFVVQKTFAVVTNTSTKINHRLAFEDFFK